MSRYLTVLVFGLPQLGDADLCWRLMRGWKAFFADVVAGLAPVDAESVADYLGRYERRLTVSHQADELMIDTVYGAR